MRHQGALAAEREAEREQEVLAEAPRVAHGGCSCSVRIPVARRGAAVKLLGLSLMLLASPAAADFRPSAITGVPLFWTRKSAVRPAAENPSALPCRGLALLRLSAGHKSPQPAERKHLI
jgi:hypothetical protein